MEYIVTTKGLTKQYRKFKALDDLNMHIPKGSIYGFVGKNGAGKTTLIRLICGLQDPTEGEYTLCGLKNNHADISKARKSMGAVVETPSIYMNMTARENLKEQYKILGLPLSDELDQILKLVGLEHTGKKKAKNFSLGMRQRLGIAIALVGGPDFLILDEPTNGLDPEGIIEIRELILRLNKDEHITFLISSHILDELSKLATNYGFIDRGHIVKEITAKELEEVCRKCLRLTVSDIKAFSRTMDRLNQDYSIISDTEVDVFGQINITKLVLALMEDNCEILSLHEHDESLEGYYINLVGGADHE